MASPTGHISNAIEKLKEISNPHINVSLAIVELDKAKEQLDYIKNTIHDRIYPDRKGGSLHMGVKLKS